MSSGQRPRETLWDKLDVVVKGVGIILVSGAVAFYGIISERRQFQIAQEDRRGQILVQTVSSREMAASEMRAQMFDTLLEHYFRDTEDELTKVEILEMIGHNFQDYLNLKPLFVALDEELARKGSSERSRLRRASRNIIRNELNKIVGAGGAVCELTLTQGQTHPIECIQPLQLTLLAVTEDHVLVRTGLGGSEPPSSFEVTYYDTPLVDYSMLGEMRYSVVLQEARPESREATLQVALLPAIYFSIENRLGVDQLIGEFTRKRY